MDRTRAARWALVLAQGLTGWAILAHVMEGGLSPFVPGFCVAALAVTFRRMDHDRARAAAAFGAGMLTTGIFAGSLLDMGLLLWTGGPDASGLPTSVLLLLAASVLFAMSGAFYWTADRDEAR